MKKDSQIKLTTENIDSLKIELQEKIQRMEENSKELSKKEKEELAEAKQILAGINSNSTYSKKFEGSDVTTDKAETLEPRTNKEGRALFKVNKIYNKMLSARNKLNHITPVEELIKNHSKVVASVENLELGFASATNSNLINKVIRKTSIEVKEGEILALIGESGSGKTVVSSTLYGLAGESSRILGGKVKIYGQEVQDFTQND